MVVVVASGAAPSRRRSLLRRVRYQCVGDDPIVLLGEQNHIHDIMILWSRHLLHPLNTGGCYGLDPADSGSPGRGGECRCPSLGYKALRSRSCWDACAASVYLADGPLWGPVVAAAVGAGTGLIVSALIGGSSSDRGSSRG